MEHECPRCGEGRLARKQLNEPAVYTCGHEDFTADLRAAREFDFHCMACNHRESWTTEGAAQAAGVWHVYLEHPELWYAELASKGERFREPQDPKPEMLGRRFEAWESQL